MLKSLPWKVSLPLLMLALLICNLARSQSRLANNPSRKEALLWFDLDKQTGEIIVGIDILKKDTLALQRFPLRFEFTDPLSNIKRMYSFSVTLMDKETSPYKGKIRYTYTCESSWHVHPSGWETVFSVGKGNQLTFEKTLPKIGHIIHIEEPVFENLFEEDLTDSDDWE